MHRIDHPTADITDPLKPKFTEGNPGLGTPATIVTDDWLNDVQENILKVIETAGISETKGNDSDLYDAIAALIAAGAGQGNYSGVEILTGNKTITSADKGKYFHLNANNIVITLPNPNTLAIGTRFVFSQISNTGGSISAASGNIHNAGSNVTATSFSLTNKADFEIVVVSSTLYHMMPHNGAASLSTSGYQQLPSGLIIQWGNVANAASRTVTWPIAFPNAVVGAYGTSRVDDDTVQCPSPGTSSAAFLTNSSITGGSTTNGFYWFAVGY